MAIVRKRINEFSRASKEAIEKSLDETVAYLLMLIRIMAPVDTGRLRDSYEEAKVAWNTRQVGTDVEYGIYQELGTYKMRAQPHILPAFVLGYAYLLERLKANYARSFR